MIARRSAILLGGTAAIALSIAQPASAISVNDQAAAGGIANYYDAGNQFPNVVSLFGPGVPGGLSPGSFCTGSLINSRTILTAAHCFVPSVAGIPSISFAPIASSDDPNFRAITSFYRNTNFAGAVDADIALISLAKPLTTISPVILGRDVPVPGTVLTAAGFCFTATGPSVAGAAHT